jgi:hypothetical protein
MSSLEAPRERAIVARLRSRLTRPRPHYPLFGDAPSVKARRGDFHALMVNSEFALIRNDEPEPGIARQTVGGIKR